MCFGSKWMLMWRSGPCCSSAMVGPSIAAVRITVLAVGRLRPPFADDVAHYAKLLSGHARIELVEVREEDRAARRIPPEAYVSLLAAEGKELDSIGFARFIEERRMSRRDLCFVIGGAFGVELERADHRLSLGPMTLPHQLARVVLLEQLFRAHKIIAGEPYHH
jgi:23S rRNA (pseudouridine1915-N3)-methyltransferase